MIFLFCWFSTILFSQETSKPITNIEITRNVSILDIEGNEYKNVKVTLKSKAPDYYFSEKQKVKVTVQDQEGNEVWKKTLKNVYLYVFSDGQIQVGIPKIDRILIYKSATGLYYGKIREKEGIF